VLVEQLRRGVQERASRGQARTVDQAVDLPEARHGLGNRSTTLINVPGVCPDEHRPAPGRRRQFGREVLSDVLAPARDRHVGTVAGRCGGYRRAQALGPAVDQHYLARQQVVIKLRHLCSPRAMGVITAAS